MICCGSFPFRARDNIVWNANKRHLEEMHTRTSVGFVFNKAMTVLKQCLEPVETYTDLHMNLFIKVSLLYVRERKLSCEWCWTVYDKFSFRVQTLGISLGQFWHVFSLRLFWIGGIFPLIFTKNIDFTMYRKLIDTAILFN